MVKFVIAGCILSCLNVARIQSADEQGFSFGIFIFCQIRTLDSYSWRLSKWCIFMAEALEKCFPTNTHFPKQLMKKNMIPLCKQDCNTKVKEKYDSAFLLQYISGRGKREKARKYFYFLLYFDCLFSLCVPA